MFAAIFGGSLYSGSFWTLSIVLSGAPRTHYYHGKLVLRFVDPHKMLLGLYAGENPDEIHEI
jgi:hypothetical protein